MGSGFMICCHILVNDLPSLYLNFLTSEIRSSTLTPAAGRRLSHCKYQYERKPLCSLLFGSGAVIGSHLELLAGSSSVQCVSHPYRTHHGVVGGGTQDGWILMGTEFGQKDALASGTPTQRVRWARWNPGTTPPMPNPAHH